MSDPKSVWAVPLWDTIHIFAASLREGDGEAFIKYLWSLTQLLPCDMCRENLEYKLTNFPPAPYMTNNKDALYYTYMVHDMVNESVNKKEGRTVKTSPPFAAVYSKYMKLVDNNCKDCEVV